MAESNGDLSPALQLIDTVWNNCLSYGRWSWLIYNGTLNQALMMAIQNRFKFHKDDFRKIYDSYQPGYWMGHVEYLYALAVLAHNDSACRAIERRMGRKSWIVYCSIRGRRRSRHSWRLHVDSILHWKVPPTQKIQKFIKDFSTPLLVHQSEAEKSYYQWLDTTWRETPKPCKVSGFDAKDRIVLTWRRDGTTRGHPDRTFRITKKEFLAARKIGLHASPANYI